MSDNRTALLLLLTVTALAPLQASCFNGIEPSTPSRPPFAEQWYQRALREYRAVAIDEASDSARHALDIVPADEQVRLLAARVALARLEYAEVVRLLRGISGSKAAALRGRALWYSGDLEKAADEFDALLADPEVVDPWAVAVSKLARRGAGRKPFAISGGLLAAVDLPRTSGVPFYVIPLEIDGAEALAMVATRHAEVVLDSATRKEPSWVSLRFGERLEVKDVPALTQDLSALSRQFGGAPIKALLGANLLRQVNATLDHRGRQFVARSFVPPPPPVASRVDLYYLRGGGMVMGSQLGDGDGQRASLFIDTAMGHSVSLDLGGWQKLGIDANKLPLTTNGSSEQVRSGSIPLFSFGAFKLPQIPAVLGTSLEQVEQELDIDVDGIVGAGLLSSFRLTFTDQGRVLWVEQSGALLEPRPPLPRPTIPKDPLIPGEPVDPLTPNAPVDPLDPATPIDPLTPPVPTSPSILPTLPDPRSLLPEAPDTNQPAP